MNSRKLTSAALVFFAGGLWAQDPPGKAAAQRICIQCHEFERSIAPRQNRAGWQATMDKMISLGAKGTQTEFDAIVDYLAATYPADEVAKIKINDAVRAPVMEQQPIVPDWAGKIWRQPNLTSQLQNLS